MHCVVFSSTPEHLLHATLPASGFRVMPHVTLSCAVPPRRTLPTVDGRRLDTSVWQAAEVCHWWSHETLKETPRLDTKPAAVHRPVCDQQPCAPAATYWMILLAPQLLYNTAIKHSKWLSKFMPQYLQLMLTASAKISPNDICLALTCVTLC